MFNRLRQARTLVPGLTLLLILGMHYTSSSAAPATQERVWTIAMVMPRDDLDIEIAYRDFLRKRKISVHFVNIRSAGRMDDATLVARVRDVKPDLIYSWGTPTTLALAGPFDTKTPEKYIRDIPIVFAEVTDPVGTRLLPSMDHTARNVTGVSHIPPLSVQLNVIKSYRPFAKIGYIINADEPNVRLNRAALGRLADKNNFVIVDETLPLNASGAPDPGAIAGAVKRLAASKVDFLYIGPSTFLAFDHRDALTQAALDARLPTYCTTDTVVREANCLFGLISSGPNIGRFAAFKTVQILAGQAASEIPAETLQRFTLLVNMRVARALALYPPLLMLDAAEIIGERPAP